MPEPSALVITPASSSGDVESAAESAPDLLPVPNESDGELGAPAHIKHVLRQWKSSVVKGALCFGFAAVAVAAAAAAVLLVKGLPGVVAHVAGGGRGATRI